MRPVLELRDVRKGFTQHLLGGRRTEVLRGVDLDVAAGECVALTGPSGSGKSTLLRCVYGQAPADAGAVRVWVDDRPVEVAAAAPRDVLRLRRSAVGLATQFLDVVPRVSALDLVAGEGLEGEPAAELLAELGLPRELHDVPPATFSGGQRQVLNLALTLARPRPLLLLDEVTASLDPGRRQAALDVLARRRRDGCALLAVFHDVPRQPDLVDRVVVLREGRVVSA